MVVVVSAATDVDVDEVMVEAATPAARMKNTWNSRVASSSTLTKPATLGVSMPKSAIGNLSEPTTSMVSPRRCACNGMVTARGVPWISRVPRASTASSVPSAAPSGRPIGSSRVKRAVG